MIYYWEEKRVSNLSNIKSFTVYFGRTSKCLLGLTVSAFILEVATHNF